MLEGSVFGDKRPLVTTPYIACTVSFPSSHSGVGDERARIVANEEMVRVTRVANLDVSNHGKRLMDKFGHGGGGLVDRWRGGRCTSMLRVEGE